jgi:hypothetical protein
MYLFVINNAGSTSDKIASNIKGLVIMDWKGCAMKCSYPTLRCSPLFRNWPGRAEENKDNLIRMAGLRAEI